MCIFTCMALGANGPARKALLDTVLKKVNRFDVTIRATGGWESGAGWGLLRVRKNSVTEVLTLLRSEAPWCTAVAKSCCELGFAPDVFNPEEAQARRWFGVATPVRLPSAPRGMLTVLTATTQV
jgi:hypothetical protein